MAANAVLFGHNITSEELRANILVKSLWQSISVILRGLYTHPCFPGVLLTSIPHNSTAFPHNHCRNKEHR